MIVLGTYEGNLVGWRQVPDEPRTLIMSFAFNAHSGCVKTCAIDKSKLATLITAGVDEQIRIYNLNSQREVGVLMEHTATITCSDFWGKANAITGDATGHLCIWRGEVTGVAIHDTGRMAVSVGADKTLQLWDLSKGNQMVKMDLPEAPQGVMWAPGCKQFAVTLQGSVQIHSGATGDVLATLPHSSKPTCAVYTAENVLVTGCADSSLRVWNTEAGALLRVLSTGHTRRIKSIDWLAGDLFDMAAPAAEGTPAAVSARRDVSEGNSDLAQDALQLAKRKHKEINTGVAVGADSGNGILVTVCSAGLVKLWDLGVVVAGASDTDALVAAAADDEAALGWALRKTSWGQAVTELVQPSSLAPLATLWGAQGSRVTCTAVGRVVRTATAASMTDVAREAVAAVGGVLPPSVKKAKAPKKPKAQASAPKGAAAAASGARGVQGGNTKKKAVVRMSVKKARQVAAQAAAAAPVPAPAPAVPAQSRAGGKKRPRSHVEGGSHSASAPVETGEQMPNPTKRAAKGPKQKGKFAQAAPLKPRQSQGGSGGRGRKPGATQAVPTAGAGGNRAGSHKAAGVKKAQANTSAVGTGAAAGAASGGGGGVVSFLSAKEGRSLMRASRKKQKNRAKRAERQADRLGTE